MAEAKKSVGYEKSRQKAMVLGVKIYEHQGPDILHAKMVLLDRSALFFGSYNWDFRSQNLNCEVGAEICNPSLRSESVEELTDEELADLVEAFKARKALSNSFYRLFYPPIEKQL